MPAHIRGQANVWPLLWMKGGSIMFWKFLTDLWMANPSYPNEVTDWLLQTACVIEDERKMP